MASYRAQWALSGQTLRAIKYVHINGRGGRAKRRGGDFRRIPRTGPGDRNPTAGANDTKRSVKISGPRRHAAFYTVNPVARSTDRHVRVVISQTYYKYYAVSFRFSFARGDWLVFRTVMVVFPFRTAGRPWVIARAGRSKANRRVAARARRVTG